MSVQSVFGAIGHELKVIGQGVVHGLQVIWHDVDVIFTDTLKAAKLLGYSDQQIMAAVAHAASAAEMYVVGKQPEWTADVVKVLQDSFVKNSLIEKTGLGPAIATELTGLVGRLFSSGSSKLSTLVTESIAQAESNAGLTGG